MRLLHPVTGVGREVPDRVLPIRLQGARSKELGVRAEDRGHRGEIRAQRVEGNLPVGLERIIRPEAQVRWLLPSVGLITPQYLEAILRGALTGNHVFQWQLFDLMEDTWPRLVKNLNELKRAAIGKLRKNWRVSPWTLKGEGPTPEAVERAQLVEEALIEMPGDAAKNENGFGETLYDMLDAWGKGTSVLEIEWEQRESGRLGTIVAPKNTYWVHPKNYAWDGAGNLGLVLPEEIGDRRKENGGRSVYSPWSRTDTRMQEAGGLIELPEDKFIVAISRARTGHPLGGPLLRPLAWWWCASNFSADWLLNYAQIFGLPIRWANYAPGATQETVNAICDMLANMGSAGWGAFPSGTTIDLKEASKGGNEMPQASVLDRADTQCDLLILGQTLTTQVRREGGARALGEVHKEVRDEIVDSVAEFAAEILNRQVVKSVIQLNYGDGTMLPAWVPNEEEPEAAKSNAEVLQIAVATGIPVPMRFALEKLNIPEAEEGEEMVEAPAPVQAQGAGSREQGAKGQEEAATEMGKQKAESRNGNGAEAVQEARRNDEGRMTNDEGMTKDEKAELNVTGKLVDRVMEELTGIEARWLGGVKPFFRNLVVKAKSEVVTDKDFVKALERARGELPELFHKLDSKAVASALEAAMGAACVNGAIRGSVERRMTNDE